MVWVWVVVIVVLVGAVVVLAVGRAGTMTEVYDDRPDTPLPTGRPLTADDIRDIRFTTAVRGYRMDEVDAFLARLSADLLAREPAQPATTQPASTEPAVPETAAPEAETDAGQPTAEVEEHPPPGAHREPSHRRPEDGR